MYLLLDGGLVTELTAELTGCILSYGFDLKSEMCTTQFHTIFIMSDRRNTHIHIIYIYIVFAKQKHKLYMNIWASYGKMISQTTGSLDFSMPPAQDGHSRPKVAQGPSYTCSAFRSTCSQLVGVSHHFWLPKIIWIKWLPKKNIILVGWIIGNLIPPMVGQEP